LCLYDAEILEEELQFEEMLMREENPNLVAQEEAEKKRQAAIEFMKYAEEKFKAEKKEKGVISMIKEKKNIIKDSLQMIVGSSSKKLDTITHEATEGNLPYKLTHAQGSPALGPSALKKVGDEQIREKRPSRILVHAQDEAVIPVTKFKPKKRRRHSEHFSDDLQATESKVNFFRREIFDQKFRNLSLRLKKLLKGYYDELITKRAKYRERAQKKLDQTKNLNRGKNKPRGFGPWDVLWEYKAESIKRESPYAEFSSYRLRQVIVKGGDDLRQEIIAMKLIRKLLGIFKKEGTSLFLKSYEIVVISASSGMLGSLSITGRIHTRFHFHRRSQKAISRTNIDPDLQKPVRV
jgi:hypothetical protein